MNLNFFFFCLANSDSPSWILHFSCIYYCKPVFMYSEQYPDNNASIKFSWKRIIENKLWNWHDLFMNKTNISVGPSGFRLAQVSYPLYYFIHSIRIPFVFKIVFPRLFNEASTVDLKYTSCIVSIFNSIKYYTVFGHFHVPCL